MKLLTYRLINPDREPDYLVATSSIRPGEWLAVDTAHGYILYVADEDAAAAKQLFPDVPVAEIDNKIRALGPEKCAN